MNVADYLLEKSCGLDKYFVVGTKEKILYRDLCKKVNALSAYIYKKFGSGNEMVLLSENNLFFIIGYLSIIKSGNVVMLLETRITEDSLERVLNRCSARAAFVQDKLLSKFKNLAGKFNLQGRIFNESLLRNLSPEPEKIDVVSDDDDLALIIFTSGSTGDKKGVMLTHKNIMANTESIIAYLKLKEDDRVEVALPFFYSYGLSLLNTHLRVGGSMVLNHSIFLGSVINEVKQYECTGFAGVPSTFQILIIKTDFLKQQFPSLRYFTQAGGKLADKFIKEIVTAFDKKSFFVMYGATEATTRLSYLPPELVVKKLGSIGKGIPGVKLEVLNADGKPVKPGETGEIVAQGDNIMKGYYKDQQKTEEVLKNRKFYTGDLATVDQEGFIYVIGRSNDMIKSAGYRIFPSEIERVVESISSVLDCVVLGLPDDIMGEAIVACVLTKNPSEKLKSEILSHCNRVLPSFKIPKHVVLFSDFPLNFSNKIDRIEIKKIASSQIK